MNLRGYQRKFCIHASTYKMNIKHDDVRLDYTNKDKAKADLEKLTFAPLSRAAAVTNNHTTTTQPVVK